MTAIAKSIAAASLSKGGVSGLLNTMKIKAKLIGGFAIVLLILLCVSTYEFLGFVRINHDVDLFSKAVEEANSAAAIEINFLKLGTHARDYGNLGRTQDADAVQTLAGKVQKSIDHAFEVVTEPSHRAKVEEIATAFGEYMSLFSQAKLLKTEHDMLVRDRLFPQGEKIVKDLKLIIIEAKGENNAAAVDAANVALEHALLIRVYTNIMIGQRDESYAAKTEAEFGEFTKAMTALKSNLFTAKEAELFKDAEMLFQDYQKTFDKVHEDLR